MSLRGLGAERTLVLVNGRRAGPAGTRGAVASFDLNVLPSSIIQSVEILKSGASSIYGSDAIAGVVNLITRRNTDGIEFRGFVSVPEEGGGETYNVNATFGTYLRRRPLPDHRRLFQAQRARAPAIASSSTARKSIFSTIEATSDPRADLLDPRTGEIACGGSIYGLAFLSALIASQNNLFTNPGPNTVGQPAVQHHPARPGQRHPVLAADDPDGGKRPSVP